MVSLNENLPAAEHHAVCPTARDKRLRSASIPCIVGTTPTKAFASPIMVDAVRLFRSAVALEATGLTRSQLREWTGRGRRDLISPDVSPGGPGRHALYTWQSLLVLRLLLVLRNDFAAEVGAWAPAAKDLREKLNNTSFPSLWHLSVFFPNRETAVLIDEITAIVDSGLLLPLEPHLTVLASKLSLPRPVQLSLFLPVSASR